MDKTFEQKAEEAQQMKQKAELSWRLMRASQRWNTVVNKLLNMGKERRSTIFGVAEDPAIVNLNEDRTLMGRIKYEFPPGRSLIGAELADDSSDDEDSDSDAESDKSSASSEDSEKEPQEKP